MTLGLIWAQAANGVLGVDGGLPWHLPEDMAQFRDRTMGATVVMGRRTWQSLPERFRPLPGRRNIVLSRRADLDTPGADLAASLEAGLASATGDVWVIGGARVYAEALPLADLIVVTELADAFEGDVFAPRLDSSWQPVERQPATGWAESVTGLRFFTTTLRRRPR